MIVSGKVHEIVFIIQKLNLVEKKIQELKKIEFSADQHYFFKELSDLLRRVDVFCDTASLGYKVEAWLSGIMNSIVILTDNDYIKNSCLAFML